MNVRVKTVTFKAPMGRLLEVLDDRSQDIVSRRFGLQTGSRETLESIGREYGITRERVRQIESHAKKILRTRLELLDEVAGLFENVFKTQGGILPHDKLTDLAKQESDEKVVPAVINFYLELLPPYEYRTNDPVFVSHWRHPELVAGPAEKVAQLGQQVLAAAKEPRDEQTFVDSVKMHVSREFEDVPEVHVNAWLEASRHITRNPFGEWGLVGWAEMTPRGVGDKAYAVLRRHSKPEHFRNIAEMINTASFDRKVANAQTVHNELIKDDRFVLVGRGLYGLTQWGYVPGTVADVVESVLRKASKPMSREEIIEKVLAQRMVKKNTILLSLQDQARFSKVGENSYTLKA